jgi:hypothetical protein
MSDASHVPLTPARGVEGSAGVLASLCGLMAVGIVSFAPRYTVHRFSSLGGETISYPSLWEFVIRRFLFSGWAGLAALGMLLLCVLCLIAIGAGAYAHAVQQAARGARWLWLGTAVLALVLTIFASAADTHLVPFSILAIFVTPLLPALVLAALASGIAVTR